MATEIAFHIAGLKLYGGERGMEQVCGTADLFFVILSCMSKAVPSNDYQYKKKI